MKKKYYRSRIVSSIIIIIIIIITLNIINNNIHPIHAQPLSTSQQQQWTQKGHDNVNVRESAMVDMGNNFTLMFGGVSLSGSRPSDYTYILGYNQYSEFKTRNSPSSPPKSTPIRCSDFWFRTWSAV